MEIWTVGHSLRPHQEMRRILEVYRVSFLADVRRFPGERKNPGFGAEVMEKTCLDLGITYVGLGRQLGGARAEGYRDHLDTDVFREGFGELIDLARRKRTAVFCREAFWFRCHRKYIADELVREGWNVTHVLDAERCLRHRVGSYRVLQRPDECE